MDYYKTIKTCLEDESCLKVIQSLNLDPELILKASINSNLCCSSNSFLYIYLEQAASFLALSLNRLCKTNEKSVVASIQRLSINAVPVGQFKKCVMNSTGTYIMVIYDKCLSIVEMPSKWGKYDQYNGGSGITMCKSNKLSHSAELIDATWHSRADTNRIVCLTHDNFVRIYHCENLKSPLKEYHLQSIYHEEQNSRRCIRTSQNIDMGNRFIYNGKPAYPIYVLKPTGQVECLIDYDSSKGFEYLGELRLTPSSELLDDPQVVSVMCLSTYPNCLVLLLENFTVFHCLFMPKSRGYDANEENQCFEESNTDEAVLYIYETINLDESTSIENVEFLSDPSNSARYFILHETGVHSVFMPWLERLQVCYLNQNNLDSMELDEASLASVDHLFCTQAFANKASSSHITGLSVLHGFGATSSMLVGLNSQGGWVCANIQRVSALDSARNQILTEGQVSDESTEASDEFTSYIDGILKRDINLPILSSHITESLNENESNLFMKQIINLIRFEYIEKQKLVILEFQKRSKVLKQQDKLQFDIVQEINSKMEGLNERRTAISQKYDEFNKNQSRLKQAVETCFNKLLEKRPLPMNSTEKDINRDLMAIKQRLDDSQFEIRENMHLVSRNESLGLKPDVSAFDPSDMDNLRSLIKNESEKIKQLVQKIEKLKVAVRI